MPTTPAKPRVGNWDVPFVTCGEFKIPTTHGFATRGRNFSVPSPPPKGIGPMCLSGKLDLIALIPTQLSSKKNSIISHQ